MGVGRGGGSQHHKFEVDVQKHLGLTGPTPVMAPVSALGFKT